MESSVARSTTGYRAGRATLLRVAQTLLEPLLALRRRPTRAGQMRATRPAWAAEMRATSRAPGPSLARIGPTRNETSSRWSARLGYQDWWTHVAGAVGHPPDASRATVNSVRVYPTPGFGGGIFARCGVRSSSVRLSPAEHSWTWTGHNDAGKQVHDGYYVVRGDVTFPAQAPPGPVVLGRAFVHRHYFPGYLTSQFPGPLPAVQDDPRLHDRWRTTNARSRHGRPCGSETGPARSCSPASDDALRSNLQVPWDGRDARGRGAAGGPQLLRRWPPTSTWTACADRPRTQKVVDARRGGSLTASRTSHAVADARADQRSYVRRSVSQRLQRHCHLRPPALCGSVTVQEVDRFAARSARAAYRTGTRLDLRAETERSSLHPQRAESARTHATRRRQRRASPSSPVPRPPVPCDQGSPSVAATNRGDGVTRSCSGPLTSDHTISTPCASYHVRRSTDRAPRKSRSTTVRAQPRAQYSRTTTPSQGPRKGVLGARRSCH